MNKNSKFSRVGFINFIVIIIYFIPFSGNAQYSTIKVKSKHEIYTDSLKNVEYNHIFPILGQAAYKKGFDIPYPTGIMGNYMWMEQGILIDNLQLGVLTDTQDIPLTDVDFVQFGNNTNTSYTVNVRPDLWVLPFLNVYGIFGYGNSHTEVNLVAPVELKSIVDQSISTFGIGIMGAGGIGPVWFSVDANFTWNKPELLDEATRVNVVGLRLGHTITFKEKPDSNFAFWVGGMNVKMDSKTQGQIKMIDALPPETWARRDQIVNEYNVWYEGLDPIQQKLVDATAVPEIIDRLDAADGESIIRYGMDKQVKQSWNGLIGVQYQYSKNWMLRSEAGVVGNRKSFLISLNYRFLM